MGVVAQFQDAGVRAVFAGHEHNFQHCRSDGIDYFVTGGAGKVRTNKPRKFTKARTLSWAAEHHFLLVTVEGNRMTVRPIAELRDGKLADIERRDPSGAVVTGPVVVNLV